MICPICNSDKFKKIFFMREVSRITKKGYPLFKCEKCSLIRPNPLPYTDTSKLSIYDSDDNIRFYDAGEKRILFNSKEYKDYFKHFRQFEDFVKKYSITGRHLDVGCGAGHLVFLLKKQGFKSEGLEISKKIASSLKSRFKVHTTELKKIKGKYNLITLSQVLEHVEEFPEFVTEINKHLLPKGFVILSVPYLYGLIPQVLRTWWYGLGHGQHLTFFSKENLKTLFEKKGFTVIEFKLAVLDYTYKKFPKFVNTLILFFSRVINALNLGDNLYMVAIKK